MLIPSTWLSTRDNLCLLSTLTLMLDILLSPIGFNRPQIIYCKPLRSRHLLYWRWFLRIYTRLATGTRN